MKLGKRIAAALLVLALFAPGLHSFAADETLRYVLESQASSASQFTVNLKIKTSGAAATAFRVYLLYDKTCFSLDSSVRMGAVTGGMFELRDATGEAAKYPAQLSGAQQAAYGVAVIQWAAAPVDGSLPAIDATAEQSYLKLNFTSLKTTGSGRIYLSDGYDDANAPYFYEDRPKDLSGAQLQMDLSNLGNPQKPAPAPNKEPAWKGWPKWLQWIMRIIFFGWIWMR